MVVLSAALVTSGKTLIARQFVEMTRLRIDGLLSAFPKLVASGKDQTFIETETVRYVYQPLDSLYLLLITNKSSNILEDIETLRLLVEVVRDCCEIKVNAELALKHAFDIVFAFDEVISFGHRQSATLSEIKTFTAMESYEEKIHSEVEQSKIKDAIEIAKRKQASIQAEQQRKLLSAKLTSIKDSSKGGLLGVGTDSPGVESVEGCAIQDLLSSNPMAQPSSAPWVDCCDGSPTLRPPAPKNGMVLQKKLGNIFADAALGPEVVVEEAAESLAVSPLLDPVKVEIEELVVAELHEDGSIKGGVSCMGEFRVTILDTSKADFACFKLSKIDQSLKYKVHPNLNKTSQAKSILKLRDAHRAFSANAPMPLLKWQFKNVDEGAIPVSLSCWPTPEAGGAQIVVELELASQSIVLEKVCICFKVPSSAKPNIKNAEPGEADFDTASSEVRWFIPRLESGGTIEFTAACDAAALFPYRFEATRSGHTQCPIDILECYHQETNDAIGFVVEKSSVYRLTCGVLGA